MANPVLPRHLLPRHSAHAGSLRWLVLALVFVASAINYADRQIIAVLKPMLATDLGWSDTEYGHIVSAFQLTTAGCLLGAGWLVDKLGVRRGYAFGVGIWSLAAVLHGAAQSVLQFIGVRGLLGAAETVNIPSAVKTVATWFPAKERSLAMGIVNAAPNIGAVMVPLFVPALALAVGWRASFMIVGSVGFVWLAVWLALGRRVDLPPGAAAQVDASAPVERTPWLSLLADRRTWAVGGGKFLSDICWWFLLFWAPDFFHRQYGLSLAQIGAPLALVYLLAATGSFTGGYVSSRLIASGVSVNAARKGVMLVAALMVTPIPLVLQLDNYWLAALMLGVTLAAHQAFSTNMFAFTTDVFPARVIGSVIGIGSTAGTLGGMGMLELTGFVLDRGLGYQPMFLICAVAYLLAVGWLQLMVPRIQPVGGPRPFAAAH